MDSSGKRSLKITNSRQFQVLVSLMQENVQLAKCLPATGRARIFLEDAWDDVAREVNLYGPPVRRGSEWKKIWCDLKSRTKRKISENSKNMKTCSEGSCRALYLTDLEQSIDKILDLSTIVSQVLNEPKDTTFDSILDDILEAKTEPEEFIAEISESSKPPATKQHTEANIQISESSKTSASKKSKTVSQMRLMVKRKHERAEKQFKLLQKHVKSEEQILEVIQKQATATKALAAAASRQAEAMATIADSTQSIAQTLQDAIKYIKRD